MSSYNGPLSNPPAREALVDIQFEPAVPIDSIKEFETKARDRYAKSAPVWQAMFGLSLTTEGAAPTHPSPTAIGFRLDSQEPPHVLQCRTSGFTFSRLSPYGGWRDLRDAAKLEWDALLKFMPPFTVKRIAVRYINDLKLPGPLNDFADFLSCPPEVPADLPQGVSSFLQRVVVPDAGHNCISIITQSLDDGPHQPSDEINVLLDIDVFRMTNIAPPDFDRIWSGLDELREQKNRMFFGHITDRLVEQFK
jgi:uncharacterized protein (TIGR04255 family)